MPRSNHYNIRLTQIFQDEYKVVMLYHYDNRWRVIWTDGREAPQSGGRGRRNRAARFGSGGFSATRSAGGSTITRSRSRRLERCRKTGSGSIRRAGQSAIRHASPRHSGVWTMTRWCGQKRSTDPKVYARPWDTMKLPLRLHDPRTDIMDTTARLWSRRTTTSFSATPLGGKGAP